MTHLLKSLFFVGATSFILSACNVHDPQISVEQTNDGTDAGGESDVVEDTGPDVNGNNGDDCGTAQTLCDDQCVDTLIDVDHCGGCNSPCGLPDDDDIPKGAVPICVEGQCSAACPEDMTDCDGTCVDLESDGEHCGQCSYACFTGLCSESSCEPPPCDVDDPLIGGGDGTEQDPYVICTSAHLELLRNSAEQIFVLAADISLAEEEFDAIENFASDLDGLGMTISDLSISAPELIGEMPTLGLFADVATQGRISNLNLIDISLSGGSQAGAVTTVNRGIISNVHVQVEIDGNGNLGGITGTNFGQIIDSSAQVDIHGTGSNLGGLAGSSQGQSQITGSSASGSITSSGDRAGGLVGDLDDQATIQSSSAEVDVEAQRNVGGLVGRMRGQSAASNVTASGSVTASGREIGGLVGYLEEGDLRDCGASGNVSGNRSVGGLVGELKEGSITRCRASGNVQGIQQVGGLVGRLDNGELHDVYATGAVNGDESVGGLIGEFRDFGVINAYAAGMVTGNDEVGGLVGDERRGDFMNSYWDIQTTGQSSSGSSSFDVQGRMIDDFGEQANFPFWDFDAVWTIADGDDSYVRPRLQWEVE